LATPAIASSGRAERGDRVAQTVPPPRRTSDRSLIGPRSLRRLVEQRTNRFREWREITHDDLVDLIHVDPEILVGEQVAQSGDRLPGDVRVSRSRLISEALHRLAHDHEVVQDRVPLEVAVDLAIEMGMNGR